MVRIARPDKLSVKYWEGRLFKPTYGTKDGRTVENTDWYVSLCFRGEAHKIFLQTMDKKQAAERALEAYFLLRASGWTAVLEKYSVRRKCGGTAEKAKEVMAGEFLGLVGRRCGLSEESLKKYAGDFYRILEEMFDLDFGRQKYDHVHGGNLVRQEKLNGIRLSKITAERVEAWRSDTLERRVREGVRQESAITTINSILRSAKSLFAKKNLKAIGLEDFPSPFSGITLWREESHRYATGFSVQDLADAAVAELRGKEEYKIFLLAAGCGLRRNEIDKLLWSHVDFGNSSILVCKTAYMRPKSKESVFMDGFVSCELAELQKTAKGEFVLEDESVTFRTRSSSPKQPAKKAKKSRYRCGKAFERLTRWLRAKGVPGRSLVHVLRKEFASQICKNHGIYAASRALRHSFCSVTKLYYADKAPAVSPGIFSSLVERKNLA
jgi:integrase